MGVKLCSSTLQQFFPGYMVRKSLAVGFREGSAAEISLPEKVLICHYLLNASGESLTGQLIAFRDIPDGRFYDDAFRRRARNPFLAAFGSDLELFRKCAAVLGGAPTDAGDAAMIFHALPKIPIQVILWAGDEEFPPDATILFDAGISGLLPAEDVVVLSSMLIYRLMGIARELKQEREQAGRKQPGSEETGKDMTRK